MEFAVLANKEETIFKIGIKECRLPGSSSDEKEVDIHPIENKECMNCLNKKFTSTYISRNEAEKVVKHLNQVI
jgi:hypothetical protein